MRKMLLSAIAVLNLACLAAKPGGELSPMLALRVPVTINSTSPTDLVPPGSDKDRAPPVGNAAPSTAGSTTMDVSRNTTEEPQPPAQSLELPIVAYHCPPRGQYGSCLAAGPTDAEKDADVQCTQLYTQCCQEVCAERGKKVVVTDDLVFALSAQALEEPENDDVRKALKGLVPTNTPMSHTCGCNCGVE